MKKTLLPALVLLLFTGVFAQQMQSVSSGFNSFVKNEKKLTRLLEIKTNPETKIHPEYGVLPYNAPCAECIELIDKRTIDSRLYIDPNNEGHTWSQKSYFPLHYKKHANDIWRTIDYRLQPTDGKTGVYEAANQPTPTRCDMNKQTTTIDVGEMQFEFNKGLKVYFFDEGIAYTQPEAGNYTNNTIGNGGLMVKNMWPGVDMRQSFRAGEIETDYIINSPLQLPITKGWMVIEDHFTLPNGFTFEEAGNEEIRTEYQGYYQGDYLLKNAKGETLLTYEKPVYIDARVWGIQGHYKLLKTGNDYTLGMYVPIDWLTNADNVYPLVIDPKVWSNTKLGDYISKGRATASMHFTDTLIGSCDYTMNVYLPKAIKPLEAYVEVEYELTYSPFCGSPNPLPAPYCQFEHIGQQVVCDTCKTASEILACRRGNGPNDNIDRICTTDSIAVPGAKPVRVTTPGYLACITTPISCLESYLGFTLKNMSYACNEACKLNCAKGTLWIMTVEGEQDMPQITRRDNRLISSHISGNQWLYNNNPIDNATDTQYVITKPGIYALLNDSSSCPSEEIEIECLAFFEIVPTSTPGIYSGINLSVGDYMQYLWDFGDGTTSANPYPKHKYAQPGEYNVCLSVTNGNTCADTYCDSSFYVFKTEGGLMSELNIVGPNSVIETNRCISVAIYPNPATDQLMIKAVNFQPQYTAVIDMNGRKSIEQKFAPQLNISSLNSGIYFIEVKGIEGVVRRRFIKQ